MSLLRVRFVVIIVVVVVVVVVVAVVGFVVGGGGGGSRGVFLPNCQFLRVPCFQYKN